ncbi:hypothetical protein BDF14DRAFT_1039316 [Spinellus fusiger]|nr:hypothetical protein BDF14DRAFT_1039316 [Spinellus fusiger]
MQSTTITLDDKSDMLSQEGLESTLDLMIESAKRSISSYQDTHDISKRSSEQSDPVSNDTLMNSTLLNDIIKPVHKQCTSLECFDPHYTFRNTSQEVEEDSVMIKELLQSREKYQPPIASVQSYSKAPSSVRLEYLNILSNANDRAIEDNSLPRHLPYSLRGLSSAYEK